MAAEFVKLSYATFILNKQEFNMTIKFISRLETR